MPLPKRRRSNARQAKRRIKCRIAAPNLTLCPQCGRTKMPHRVCPHCGYYKGKEIVHIEAEKTHE
jgi:large subunit ribosomal protein L32